MDEQITHACQMKVIPFEIMRIMFEIMRICFIIRVATPQACQCPATAIIAPEGGPDHLTTPPGADI